MCPANGFLFFPMIDTPIELAISEIPIAIIDMSVYTFNFQNRVKEESRYFYAIAPVPLIRSAVENTFAQLNWDAQWVKRSRGDGRDILLHHPGGWTDRGLSRLVQSALSRGHYGSDKITVTPLETNNPVVSLLITSMYLKCPRTAKEKQEERAISFYKSLEYEFRKLEIPLVEPHEWQSLIDKNPALHCSPIWGFDANRNVSAIPAR